MLIIDQATMQWLKKQLASGYTREQLEGLLRQQGDSEQEINQAFKETGAAQATAKTKTSPLPIILIFLFLGLSIVAGIFAYNQYQENADLQGAVNAAKKEVVDKEDEMSFKIERLESEVNSTKVRYEMIIETKDQTIKELNATVRDLRSQLDDQQTGQELQTEGNVSETSIAGLFGDTPEETPQQVVEETEPNVQETVIADENTPLAFPNSTVEYNLEEQVVLTTAVYNEDTDWAMFQGRVYCLDEFQEEFELADITCEWVAPLISEAFTIVIPPRATTWRGNRACYVEFWQTDETCEEKLGKLMQVPFEMDIY